MKAKGKLVFIYFGLLVVSGIWKTLFPFEISPREGQDSILVTDSERGLAPVEIRYLDTKRDTQDLRPVILLIHGSPAASGVFDPLDSLLDETYRVVSLDLPGFGRSARKVSDYSILAHSYYLEAFLEALDIKQCHVLGYSMGGGVGLEFASRNPDSVKSIILASSIGMQEYELLGDYTLNHALHAGQLVCFWALDWLTPHFGWYDRALLNTQYARNFYDSDQRPLESMMRNWREPALIIHGREDGLVPVDTALAHKALMPHAELRVIDGAGHMAIARMPELFSETISGFVDEVERGSAARRSRETVDTVDLELPERNGWMIAALLAVATFASEDIACIGGGLLASREAVSLPLAIFGCLFGIFVGDLAIYWMGRIMGTSALDLPIARRILKRETVERCSRWFDKRGIALIVSTRFVPGSRVPTYFAAGVIKANPIRFAGALFIASAIWTPAIVGLSYYLGGAFVSFFEEHEGFALIGLLVAALSILLLARLSIALCSKRGRRLAYSKFRRLVHWEYWPLWVFYPPVVAFIIWKMMRQRSLTSLTTVNPCMPESGLVYESKSDILSHLDSYGVPIGRFGVIPNTLNPDEKLARIHSFMADYGLSYPVALKPDMGQRGQGVSIAKSDSGARAFIESQTESVIVQEFLPGREFGVFYYRMPNEAKGRVFSVTDKRFVSVLGDGKSTLETLILNHDRAVEMADFFIKEHQSELDTILPEGAEYPLAELGTHCRGALFLDGSDLITPELESAIDSMSRGVEGFHFGRYDVRAPSAKDLKEGSGIRVIELNGLTSESTNIYDPKHSLRFAYRTLFSQWSIAFAIAKENVALGHTPATLKRTLTLFVRYFLGKGPPDSES